MSSITHIRKRNGTVASFEENKICCAMQKAFDACGVPLDERDMQALTESVIEALHAERKEVTEHPTVEQIQDIVERVLMEFGYHAVAKAYILYRYEQSKERQQEMSAKIDEGVLLVLKSTGKKEPFSREKLRAAVMYATKGIEKDIDVDTIVAQTYSDIHDGISTGDITRALIMNTRVLIERDHAYSVLAARLLLSRLYKEVIGPDIDYSRLDEQHRAAFVRSIKRGVEIGRVDRALLDFDLEKIAGMMDLAHDSFFDYLGLQTIYDRYFIRDHEQGKRVLETPQMFWLRIALGTALKEKPEDVVVWTRKFYEIMARFQYMPSTPTLFHSGTPKPQLSSCYLNTVPDSLEGIFKNYADNAQLSKWSGGLGTDWSYLRGTGAFIKGTGVESQGVIPFLKIANDVTIAINRSGRRRGAACVYLEAWHYDFLDFLELRKNTGDERRRTHDMDTANWIPDLFMKRVREGGEWTLFSPDETPDLHDLYGAAFEKAYIAYEKKADKGEMALVKRLPALDVWKKMLAMLFETGHPWITFKDPCNIRSPQDHVGVVHSSNLCTEITLNTSFDETAVCNLGSLNLGAFVKNGTLDRELVGDVVSTAMRMLDNVIDINFYPTEDAKRSNMRHRPVGLGIRGYQDALYLLGIDFATEAAVHFADESMEVVAYHTILASSILAKERGAYETYRGSKWDRGIFPQDTLDLLEKERGVAIPVPRGGKLDWAPVRAHVKAHGMRNSNTMAIAPTATTANIAGCVPSIEPIYKNLFVKANQAGDFVVINKYLVAELKEAGLWNDEMVKQIKYHDGSIQYISAIPAAIRGKYKEVFEIDSRWLLRAAAYRAKWIDQSQSLNIFFGGSSGKELSDIYLYAWELGLKTTYYLRTLSASQVEKSTVGTAGTQTRAKTTPTPAVSAPAPVLEEATAPVVVASLGEQQEKKYNVCESCEG